MQKTYWWRVCLGIVCFLVLVGDFVGPCNFKFGRCLGGDSILLARTFFHIALSVVVVTPFLFFVSDIVFKKWLKFAFAWFVLAAIFIVLSPVTDRSSLGLNPTKESVSIWMGSLFVILSLILIFWQSYKLRKN